MSFLDLQDLALAVAQGGIATLIPSWWPDFDDVMNALEVGAGAWLLTLAVRQKTKG